MRRMAADQVGIAAPTSAAFKVSAHLHLRCVVVMGSGPHGPASLSTAFPSMSETALQRTARNEWVRLAWPRTVSGPAKSRSALAAARGRAQTNDWTFAIKYAALRAVDTTPCCSRDVGQVTTYLSARW
jgi:hypothetical protein